MQLAGKNIQEAESVSTSLNRIVANKSHCVTVASEDWGKFSTFRGVMSKLGDILRGVTDFVDEVKTLKIITIHSTLKDHV